MSYDDKKCKLQFPITGKKVILKRFTECHLTSEYIGWLNNKDIVRFSNQRFNHHTLASCQQYLSSFEGSDNLFLAIHVNDAFVGTMTAYIRNAHQVADMGIMLSQQVWGQGIGLDAWQTLMDYLLKSGIRKVTGGTLRCNIAMHKIMLRAGMIPDGVRVDQELVAGCAVDVLYFAKFNGE